MAYIKKDQVGIGYLVEGCLSSNFEMVVTQLIRNYKLMRHESGQDGQSPAPMPDKIFRLRTGPEKKMDAFGQDGQLLSPRFVKTRPADGALGPEQFDVDYVKFED
jgi:hypothetical protein